MQAASESSKEPKLYLGDVYPFEDHGLPEFIAHPTREFAVLPVVESGAGADRIIERNRQVIEAVSGADLRAFQLVVEWKSPDWLSIEPAVIVLSQESGFDPTGFEDHLAKVRAALEGPPEWLLCDAQGLRSVLEGARASLTQNSALEALSEGYRQLYEGRAGTCRALGLTRPQNSLSAQLFARIGLSYSDTVSMS